MQIISRRAFLAVTAGAAMVPPVSWAAEDVPAVLDHILLGCSDLDRGIAFVEEHIGVRAAFGGVHPGRGTQNALLSLGTRCYLEIIAPDPKQDHNHVEEFALKQLAHLKELTSPSLVGWAVHPGDLEKFSARLRDAGIAFSGPWPGSRKRPDGSLLQWKTLNLKDDHDGLLPFFIEWSADSLHPSADAPKGCSLLHFEAVTPDPDALSKQIMLLGLDIRIAKADKPQLRATIAGPKGSPLDITS
jgi:catechol 2,3-dioxygenase-like lactoylglutathione lyase family enzyme